MGTFFERVPFAAIGVRRESRSFGSVGVESIFVLRFRVKRFRRRRRGSIRKNLNRDVYRRFLARSFLRFTTILTVARLDVNIDIDAEIENVGIVDRSGFGQNLRVRR